MIVDERFRSIFDELISKEMKQRMREHEDELAWLLGQWVSELDPMMVVNPQSTIMGLCWAGDPKCRLVVESRREYREAVNDWSAI